MGFRAKFQAILVHRRRRRGMARSFRGRWPVVEVTASRSQLDAFVTRCDRTRASRAAVSRVVGLPPMSGEYNEPYYIYVMSTSSIPLLLCEAYPMLIYMLFTTTRTW